MLLTQRAYAEGARAFAYWVALMIDIEQNHPDPSEREAHARTDAARRIPGPWAKWEVYGIA